MLEHSQLPAVRSVRMDSSEVAVGSSQQITVSEILLCAGVTYPVGKERGQGAAFYYLFFLRKIQQGIITPMYHSQTGRSPSSCFLDLAAR